MGIHGKDAVCKRAAKTCRALVGAPGLAAAPTTSLGAVVSQAEVGVQPPAAAVWTEEVDVL